MKGILRRAGWAPRLRILPSQQPALGTCFPVSPSLSHHPHFCQPAFTWLCPGAFWDPLGVRSPGFSLGGSQRMPAAGVRGAEGVWGLVARGLGNKDTKGSVCQEITWVPQSSLQALVHATPPAEHTLLSSPALQIPPSLPDLAHVPGDSAVPTARNSRGEPLPPGLPDPTPEPRENGSDHTPCSRWEVSRRK